MHRATFPRTQRRTRCSRRLRPCRTLKNWLPRDRPSRRRTRSYTAGRNRSGCGQRRFVDGSRAGLRHDHSRRRRNRSRRPRGRRTLTLHLRDIRRRRSTTGRDRRSRSRNSRRNGDSRRCRTGGGRHRRDCGRWRHRTFGWNNHHRRRAVGGGYRSRCHHSGRGRRRRFCCEFGRRCLGRRRCGRNGRLRFCRWRWRRNRGLRYGARRGLLGCSLLLRNGAQHISRPRDIRQVDLGLDAVFFASGTRSFRRTRRCVGTAAEMFPHQFRFVLFKRT
jgi:hypothetical protein